MMRYTQGMTIDVIEEEPKQNNTGLVDHLGRPIVSFEIPESMGFYILSEFREKTVWPDTRTVDGRLILDSTS